LCDGKKDCEFGEDELNCKNPSECEFGSCSHFCENQNQKNDTKIVCKCAPGYIILEDGFNCQSNATDEPFLIYTNRYDIRMNRFQRKNESYSLEAETQSLPLVSHLRNAIDLDYFFNHTDGSALIFWSDISLDQIFCGRLHQGILNDVHPIVSFGVWTAENLAVDWIGLHIYWIDSQLGHILVSNFDGSMVTTLISGNMGNLRALAIDPSVGLLFWTDWLQTNPRIEMATMSGNNRKVLYQIKDNGGWANGLACDYISRRLYWVDAKSDSIHTINYDGTDKRQIIHDAIHLAHPFSIDVFENNVFFSDWRSKSLYRVSK
jgi:integrin beta 2